MFVIDGMPGTGKSMIIIDGKPVVGMFGMQGTGKCTFIMIFGMPGIEKWMFMIDGMSGVGKFTFMIDGSYILCTKIPTQLNVLCYDKSSYHLSSYIIESQKLGNTR